jgi:hypothetical protein
MANDSWGFCVSLFYRLGLIQFPFCLKFLFVVVIITFLKSSLFYIMFYQNCRVTSCYFVVLLKPTTQVKTLSIAHVTQFHDSRPSMSQAVSHSRLVFQHGSFLLAFVKLQNWHFALFSPGTFHSPVSILKLMLRTHILTTVHTTQSHISTPSLTKTSVCVCLKNINKEPSQQVGVLYTESCGADCYLGLTSCTSLRGQKRNWYIIIPF